MQQALVGYLINAAWQAPLVMAGAMIVARFGGLAPRARNLAWLAFLVMAVVSPALPVDLPLAERAVAQPAVAIAPKTADIAISAVAVAPTTPKPPQASFGRLLRIGLDWRSASLIKLAFCAAAAAALARLTVAALAARRLVRDSEAFAMPAHLAAALDQFGRTHACKVPPVRVSSRIGGPAVVGALRPVILVPERFAIHTEQEQQAALLHEFAHVLRRDYAVNLACEVVSVPLSWHPALYAIKAGVRRSRELACDAVASAAMASEETYARCLLSLAKSLGGQSHGVLARDQGAVVVGLFGKSSLEERLMHLLNRKGAQSPGVRTVRLIGAGLLASSILIPAAVFRVTPAFAEAQLQAPSLAAAQAQAQADAVPAPSVPATPATPPAAPARPVAPDHAVRVRAHVRAPAEVVKVRPNPASNEAVVTRRVRTDDGDESVSTVRVIDDDNFRGLSEEQQRRVEESIKRAMAQTEAVRKMIDSPEFKQRMADLTARQKELATIDWAKFRTQMAAAEAAIKDAHVQAAMARAQAQIASAAMRESLENAAKVQRDVEKSMREAAPRD